MKTKLLLYGAYGYTGQLTAERAVQHNLDSAVGGKALRIVSSAAPAVLGTPSSAFGADFALDIPKCSRTNLSYTHNPQSRYDSDAIPTFMELVR